MKINYSNVKRKLESYRCGEHGKTATVTISGDNIRVSCCCDKFKDELSGKVNQLVSDEVSKSISNMFK